jgi:hypothetical protein
VNSLKTLVVLWPMTCGITSSNTSDHLNTKGNSLKHLIQIAEEYLRRTGLAKRYPHAMKQLCTFVVSILIGGVVIGLIIPLQPWLLAKVGAKSQWCYKMNC